MASHVSERFYDHERLDLYADLIHSSLDRPQGVEQAYLLDRITSLEPRPPRPKFAWPWLSLRWLDLRRLPLPFLTWA